MKEGEGRKGRKGKREGRGERGGKGMKGEEVKRVQDCGKEDGSDPTEGEVFGLV